MERLTEYNQKLKGYFYPYCFQEDTCAGLGCEKPNCRFSEKACKKLGQYEDTGLMPEEVQELKEELEKYRAIKQQGLLLKLPCSIGDTIYVICECEHIPPQLDGTLYGSSGGYGTATGYYCPYESNCPHECEDCEECKNILAVFEDEVDGICVDKTGVHIYSKNCYVNGSLGEYIFLSESEAQEALKKLESEQHE